MLILKKFILLFVLLVFLATNSIYSQEIGEIYDIKEADKIYGPVLESKIISADELKALLVSTEDKVMFQLINNQFSILGDSSKLLYSTTNFIESNEVFHMYSKSKVLELLYSDKSQTVTLENRKDVFSITVGDFTLEGSFPCPPFCD